MDYLLGTFLMAKVLFAANNKQHYRLSCVEGKYCILNIYIILDFVTPDAEILYVRMYTHSKHLFLLHGTFFSSDSSKMQLFCLALELQYCWSYIFFIYNINLDRIASTHLTCWPCLASFIVSMVFIRAQEIYHIQKLTFIRNLISF